MPQDARILDFTAFAQGTEKPSKPAKQPPKTKARHKSGLFRLHFRYKDPFTGAAREKDVYGATKAEAERKKKAFLKQVEQGVRIAENGRTVAQWADEWLRTYKKPYVKETTYSAYANDVQRIKEMLGQRPLSAVLPSDIQRLMETRRGLSASAIKKTYMTMNAMMTAAVDNRLITFNPCRGVITPDGKSGTHRQLTQDEVDLVVSVAESGHRFGLVMLLMLFAGLRRGEALRKGYAAENETIHVSDGRRTYASPRAHMRRAHWHHFWAGPKKGERYIILKWLPPIPVNIDSSGEFPATIRPVR